MCCACQRYNKQRCDDDDVRRYNECYYDRYSTQSTVELQITYILHCALIALLIAYITH